MRGLFQKLVPLKVDLADCVEFGFIALILELCRLAKEILDLKYRAKSSTARIGMYCTLRVTAIRFTPLPYPRVASAARAASFKPETLSNRRAEASSWVAESPKN